MGCRHLPSEPAGSAAASAQPAARPAARPRPRRLAPASPCCLLTRASSWPTSGAGRRRQAATSACCAGPSNRREHLADQDLAAGQLGDVLDLLRADDHAVDRPPLDLGLLEGLDLGRDLLGQLGDALAAPGDRRGPFEVLREPVHAHVGEDPAGQRVLQHPQPDRLLPQVAAELVLGDGVQVLQVQDQQRPAAVEVRPELIHHQFFNIFAHGFGSGPRVRLDRCRPVGRRVGSAAGRGSPAQAETRMPGLMVAETVIERM